MKKDVFESMTEEERLENMFLMDKISITATKEQLEEVGLDETYIGMVGYVDTFDKDNVVTLDLVDETVKVYKHMIDEYSEDDTYMDELAEAYANQA